ncbi:hypothetical protein NEAUS04_1087 [Nematocida ausubeli]|nr:hypothetical protein NEAUS04_1087 [Nematocida ausubeli]
MQKKDSSRIKNLIIHSAILDLYYKQNKCEPLGEVLNKMNTLNRFTLIEVICAKIYSSSVIAYLPQYTGLEIFFTACIIFKKYWNDFSLKNIEETSNDIVGIKKLNRIEMAILELIKYDVHITKEQIQKEIELERNVDVNYKEAMSSIAVHVMQ